MEQTLIQTDPGDEQEYVVKNPSKVRINTVRRVNPTYFKKVDKIDIESAKDDIEDD